MVLIFFVQMLSINAFAADVGKKVGKIYSTDIIAYAADVPINSYSSGGKTGIVEFNGAKYKQKNLIVELIRISS